MITFFWGGDTQTYDNILLTEDFNAEEGEDILSEFMELKNLKLVLSRMKPLRVLILF